MTPTEPAKPFDLEGAQKAVGDALVGLLILSLGQPGSAPDRETVSNFMTSVQGALTAGTAACTEVHRVRTELAGLRDAHRPKPHADPTRAGALCATCSLDGALIAWPCTPWTAADRILTHGQP